MGGAIARLAQARPGVRVSAGIARMPGNAGEAEALGCDVIVGMADAADVIAACDVVIDVSSADATPGLLRGAGGALHGRALVVGTTGLAGETQRALDSLSSDTAVLVAANFSIGVNLLLVLAERVAGVLGSGDYDVEVVEAHHGRKVDAPSGTALALGEAVARGRGVDLHAVQRDGRSGRTGERPEGEIGMHAVRGGGVIGEHRLLFLGDRECIELRHEALDRSLFAAGAVHAAEWIAGRPPGRYTMQQVLGL